MTDSGQSVRSWVDQRIAEMLARPSMWGAPESVEFQVLSLLETRLLVDQPSVAARDPRCVIDAYLKFLKNTFPATGGVRLLSDVVAEGELVAGLQRFVNHFRETYPVESAFGTRELAVRLTFSETPRPTALAFEYVTELKRAIGAILRPRGASRDKRIEAATNFSIESMAVTPRNGVPANLLVEFGPAPGQLDAIAEQQVRDGLGHIATLAEWAATDAPLEELPISDSERRTQLAVQVRRLVPSRELKSVAIGGRLIARARPIEIEPRHEARFVRVASTGAEERPFDMVDEVRAIDLDRGLVKLGKDRLSCWLRAEWLSELSQVGVRRRISGTLYIPMKGKKFVIVDQPPEAEQGAEPDEPDQGE